MIAPQKRNGSLATIVGWQKAAVSLLGYRPRLNRSTSAQSPRARNSAIGRFCHDIGHCQRGIAALEFAIVATPLMLMTFGFITLSAVFYTWSAMQNGAQYAALMVATGQVKSLSTGAITTSNASATTACSGSLSSTEAEYYACSGLPSWVTFTVTTTENCSTPSVSVSLSASATAAAISDIFSIFSGKTLVASSVVMKQGSCP